jgi:hypothetical protein
MRLGIAVMARPVERDVEHVEALADIVVVS